VPSGFGRRISTSISGSDDAQKDAPNLNDHFILRAPYSVIPKKYAGDAEFNPPNPLRCGVGITRALALSWVAGCCSKMATNHGAADPEASWRDFWSIKGDAWAGSPSPSSPSRALRRGSLRASPLEARVTTLSHFPLIL